VFLNAFFLLLLVNNQFIIPLYLHDLPKHQITEIHHHLMDMLFINKFVFTGM